MLTTIVTGRIISKEEVRGIFRNSYRLFFELQTPEGKTLRDFSRVDFKTYNSRKVGDDISVQVYAPGIQTEKTNTSCVGTFLDEVFGSLIHPSLR